MGSAGTGASVGLAMGSTSATASKTFTVRD